MARSVEDRLCIYGKEYWRQATGHSRAFQRLIWRPGRMCTSMGGKDTISGSLRSRRLYHQESNRYLNSEFPQSPSAHRTPDELTCIFIYSTFSSFTCASPNFHTSSWAVYLPPAFGPLTPAPITLGNSWLPISYNMPSPKEMMPMMPTVVPARSQKGNTTSFLWHAAPPNVVVFLVPSLFFLTSGFVHAHP
jgi:hypothetical protein